MSHARIRFEPARSRSQMESKVTPSKFIAQPLLLTQIPRKRISSNFKQTFWITILAIIRSEHSRSRLQMEVKEFNKKLHTHVRIMRRYVMYKSQV